MRLPFQIFRLRGVVKQEKRFLLLFERTVHAHVKVVILAPEAFVDVSPTKVALVMTERGVVV